MSDLRERLAAALTSPGGCEHPGRESCDPWWRADAALPVVAGWLHDLAAVQWERSVNHPIPESREMATIRAMYLTDRAIELEGGEPMDLADALTQKEPQ